MMRMHRKRLRKSTNHTQEQTNRINTISKMTTRKTMMITILSILLKMRVRLREASMTLTMNQKHLLKEEEEGLIIKVSTTLNAMVVKIHGEEDKRPVSHNTMIKGDIQERAITKSKEALAVQNRTTIEITSHNLNSRTLPFSIENQ